MSRAAGCVERLVTIELRVQRCLGYRQRPLVQRCRTILAASIGATEIAKRACGGRAAKPRCVRRFSL